MNRSTFGKKTLNGQRPRVDRFIVPREQFPELCRKIRWGATDNDTDDVWYSKYLQQKKYANYLDEAFGLESIKTEPSQTDDDEAVQLWPCIPRKRRYLSSADSILDLPSYSYAAFPELLDWSNDNILVAALGRNYHKWSWRTQSLISQGVTNYEIHCCKFDPQGKLLILGTSLKSVEVHDNAQSKCIERRRCSCVETKPPYCSITAVDWSPTGNSFITGCSQGMLSAFSRTSQPISWCQAHHNAILIVRVSPDARYVTAAAVNDDLVCVFSWPSLQPVSTLKSDWTIKALTWHPWRSALLGIGAVSSNLQTRVALWDAPTGKLRKRTLSRNQYCLDAMLFSKKTGELVLSLWNTFEDRGSSPPKPCSQLVVLSDPETMVDQWGEGRHGLDRVRTMVFSPDGTKLATATADEDLIIWNFLPEDKRKRKKSCKRFSAIPVFLDKTCSGVSLR
ncbi:protein cortex-like [Spodoptera litura]|uniref:Protein cortex-like n=1 Tax=Spodoptera litura TaxID=69820 RepID=A0A9J7J1G8_SPOLT|nr:protein cortex-like [Spodoptera litura]